MSQPIPKFEGPIAILDMLGFKKFVENNSLDVVINCYAGILTSSSFTAEVLKENLEFMVYSDTIAIRLVNQTDDGFYNFIKALTIIMNNFFYTCQIPGYNSTPLRGAISFGEYSWYNGDIQTQVINREPIFAKRVNFIVGQAIIDAHNHESCQEWIGISMNKYTSDILRCRFPKAFKSLLIDRLLVKYEIPIKHNSTVSGYVVNPTQYAIFVSCFDAFINKCEIICKDTKESVLVKNKYINTLKFLNYIHVSDNLLPVFSIEMKKSIGILKIDKTRFHRIINSIELQERKSIIAKIKLYYVQIINKIFK